MKKITYFFCVIFLVACSSNQEKTKTNESQSEEQKMESSSTVELNQKVFVAITPSVHYTDSVREAMSEEDWMNVVSDNEYYRDMTEQFLLKNGYKKVELSADEELTFKKVDGTTSIITKKQVSEVWGNVIFNGKDDAFIYEGVMPEIDLKNKL